MAPMAFFGLAGGSKDVRQLIRAAEAQGWAVSRTRGGHLRWRAPSGALVFTASTPSDWRALANILSYLRRNGLKGV